MTSRRPAADRALKGLRVRGFAAVMAVVASAGCNDAGAPADSGPDPDSPAGQGLAALKARKCGECHEPLEGGGGTFSGRVTPAPGSQAYPANLTPDPDTGMDAWDADSIASAVLFGVNDLGLPLCTPMPRYVEAGMPPEEALAIAAYLQGLPPVWHPVPASTCLPTPLLRRDAGL